MPEGPPALAPMPSWPPPLAATPAGWPAPVGLPPREVSGARGAADEGAASEEAARQQSLGLSSSLSGATGLLRVMAAGSGAPGTFRLGLAWGVYAGRGFLCPQCPDAIGEGAAERDEVVRVAANLLLAVTPVEFLEAYAAMRSHSTATTRPAEEVEQVMGDVALGLKAFVPVGGGRRFAVGGALDVGLAAGSGEVGLGALDVAVRGLASADFSQGSGAALPLRAHVNVGYLFDNSGALVEERERERGPIDRVERFSLDVNRVDSVQLGLGVEAPLEVVQPFLEWTIDVPANRQSYVCLRREARSGDACLEDRPRFSSAPSRLSAGARVTPWRAVGGWLEGLALTGAVDVATGGASDFLVEVAPEVPWMAWLGVGLAVDPRPRVRMERVFVPVVERPSAVEGVVVARDTGAPIAGATVRLEGREATGMLTTALGRFTALGLEPGWHVLRVGARGYADAHCNLLVPSGPPASAPASAASELRSGGRPAPALPRAPIAPAPAPGTPAAASASVTAAPSARCVLEPLPERGGLELRVVDLTTGAAVGGARVQLIAAGGGSVELRADAGGAARATELSPGLAEVTITADGYLRSVRRLEIEPHALLDHRAVLAPVPASPSVRLVGRELQLATPLGFERGSASLDRHGVYVLQELARFLIGQPELGVVRISSRAGGDAALASSRALAVRDVLLLHGVPLARLLAEPPADAPAAAGTGTPPERDALEFFVEPGTPP